MRRRRRCGRKEIVSDVFLGDMVVGETGISHGDLVLSLAPKKALPRVPVL